MKSKTLIICILTLFIIILSNSFYMVHGHYSDTDGYYIDVPATYIKETEGTFVKNDNTITVSVQKEYISEDFSYDNVALTQMANEFKSGFNTSSSTITNMKKQEISTFSNQSYKCFHLLFDASFSGTPAHLDVYMVGSNNDLYALMIIALNESALSSAEVKGIINSFTITNYKSKDNSSSSSATGVSPIENIEEMNIPEISPATAKIPTETNTDNNSKKDDKEKDSFFNTGVGRAILYGGIALVVCIILGAINTNSKKENINYSAPSKENNNTSNKKEREKSNETTTNSNEWKCSECGNTNTGKFCGGCGKEKTEKNICSKCGKDIKPGTKFCDNCGNKLQ